MSYSKDSYSPLMMSINSNPLASSEESILTTLTHDQSEVLIHKLEELKLKLRFGGDVSEDIDEIIYKLNSNLSDQNNSLNTLGHRINLSYPVQKFGPVSGKPRVRYLTAGLKEKESKALLVSPDIYTNSGGLRYELFEAISESFASSTLGCDSGLKLDYVTDIDLQKRAQETEKLIAEGNNVRVICKGDEKFQGF